jgi:hypothetical protein
MPFYPLLPGGRVNQSQFLKCVKFSLALAVLLLGPGLMMASADTIGLSGTFASGGGSFTGTVTVNDAALTPGTGQVITAASLTVSGFSGGSSFLNGVYTTILFTDAFGFGFLQDSQGGTPSTNPYINLYFLQTSPISNASMCTNVVSGCVAFNSQFISQIRPTADSSSYINVGSAGATNTPEPSSLLLLTSGLAVLGFLLRRQQPLAIS